MRKFCAFVAALLLGSAAIYFSPLASAQRTRKVFNSENGIKDQYIVVLRDDVEQLTGRDLPDVASEMASTHRGSVKRTYSSALKGFAVEMSASDADELSADPRVKYIEQDARVEAESVETNAPWSLGRIDQRNWVYPLDTNYNYTATGTGVSVYVLDSGILIEHPDFGGRAVNAFDAYNDPTPISQCNGHGTHVAGTIGSTTYGVAKNVTLYSVRVLPCSGYGTSSTLLAGIDYVNQHASGPSVANLSLASVQSSVVEQAVLASINRGITYVTAAGNYAADACNYSPAHLPEAITVGSTDDRDYRDPNTNYGSCIDVFAPGVLIWSTGNLPDYPVAAMSGTSTAAPHVAGAAALYLELNPTASPAEVQQQIKGQATPGILTDIGQGSPNLFLYSQLVSSGGGGTPPSACSGTAFNGNLNGSGSFQFQSGPSGFSGGTGTYKASLPVPTGSQFKISLEKKGRSAWSTIASSSGTSSTETLQMSGKRGSYRWRVTSVSGSGSYTLCSVTP